MTIETMDSQDARRNWRAMLDGVFSKGYTYIIERYKSPIAILLPIAEYERLKSAELALSDKRFKAKSSLCLFLAKLKCRRR